MRNNNLPISIKEFLKFFEKTSNVKFIDVNTGKSALEVIAKNEKVTKSDYDIWLEQQDDKTKQEHKMNII